MSADNNSPQPLPGPQSVSLPPTPFAWRLALAVLLVGLALTAYFTRDIIGLSGRSALGVVCFILLVAVFSSNLRAVNWRTIGMGMLLQAFLALFILKLDIFGVQPGQALFKAMGGVIRDFLAFTDRGSEFVFGPLANPKEAGESLGAMDRVFGPGGSFVFAFRALPTIIFVSSFFTLLYYFGVLQLIVRLMARLMAFLLGTSGAESLSASANVFMGQTEAPLIVRPYVQKMTESELLALMAGGMATVSGGMMAVYVAIGGDSVAILATSVMAAPCGLYLAKLLLPETGEPLTRGEVKMNVEQPYRNPIDAVAGGASEGLKLALNVAAMLIAFVAFVALIDALLQLIHADLSLSRIFSTVFWPLAMLMGIEDGAIPQVADLLGLKLAVNELFAFREMQQMDLDCRSLRLSTYALTGFANFASVGIQLGGIGAMAPERRPDLARLGLRALFIGFMATLVNAALVGILT